MGRDSFNQRAAFTNPDGPYVKPTKRGFEVAEAMRRADAEAGSSALLRAIDRYLVRHHAALGAAIAGHEADKARNSTPEPRGLRRQEGAR